MQLRRTGEVEAAQLRRTLIPIAGKCQLDKQTQMFTQAAELVRKVEYAPAALAVALQVQTRNNLAIETLEQAVELGTDHAAFGAVLFLGKADTHHLVPFFLAQVVKEFFKAKYPVAFADNQINWHINAQVLIHLQQPLAGLPGERFELHFIAGQQKICG